MKEKITTIFDDYKEVNHCNKCEHYYTSACDGKKLNENPSENTSDNFCKAFMATRGYLIQEEIKRIKRHLWLSDLILLMLTIMLLLDSLGVFK